MNAPGLQDKPREEEERARGKDSARSSPAEKYAWVRGKRCPNFTPAFPQIEFKRHRGHFQIKKEKEKDIKMTKTINANGRVQQNPNIYNAKNFPAEQGD